MLMDDDTIDALVATLVAQWWPADADLRIDVMSGAMPTAIGTGSGDVLARFVIPVASVTVTGGSIAFPAGIAGEYLMDGTAGWARFVDDDETHRLYLACSTTATTGVFRMNSLSVASGVPITTMASVIRIGG